MVNSLLVECDTLQASLTAINSRNSEEKRLISLREDRIAEFDELRGKVGRFLERLLELVEMPTLAAAVRPELEGTGRRGRPSKRPPPGPAEADSRLCPASLRMAGTRWRPAKRSRLLKE